MSKAKTRPASRSSVTGQFVSPAYAAKHPKTTQNERVPNPGRGDTKGGPKSK